MNTKRENRAIIKNKTIQVLIENETERAITALSAETGRSKSDIIREALTLFLKKYGIKAKAKDYANKTDVAAAYADEK